MGRRDLLGEGVKFFNAGSYFEAHEVWEDLWRETAGPVRRFYQGLIQAAVAMHHLERGNLAGARSQLSKSLANLAGSEKQPARIRAERLIEELTAVQNDMHPRRIQIEIREEKRGE